MRSALRTAVVVIAATGILTACGSDSKTTSATGTTVDLTAANITYSPTDIKVAAGEVTFVVKNTDKVEHNLTIDDGGNVNKDVEGGKTVQAKATLKAGTYKFHCEYHPDAMKGTITVG